MKLSSRGRYAPRAMLDIALNYGKGPVSLKNISRRRHTRFLPVSWARRCV